jgi:hypothetical protein
VIEPGNPLEGSDLKGFAVPPRPVLVDQFGLVQTVNALCQGVIVAVAATSDRRFDNALAESINGLYKTELIHKDGPWRNRESLEIATLQWVTWFNHQRLLEPIGYIPPAEAEANYYQQIALQSEIAITLTN